MYHGRLMVGVIDVIIIIIIIIIIIVVLSVYKPSGIENEGE
jgi:hypothetical protein